MFLKSIGDESGTFLVVIMRAVIRIEIHPHLRCDGKREEENS